MRTIEVRKEMYFLPKNKHWSISLYSLEPYGEYCPKHIYVTSIFHKNKEKALNLAWKAFDRSKQYQDDLDEFHRSRQEEVVEFAIG